MVDEEGKSEVEQDQGRAVEEDVEVGCRDLFGGHRGLRNLGDRAIGVDTCGSD